MNIKILVATHKKYWMPSDSMYFPIQQGADLPIGENGSKIDLGYNKDNTGENISLKKENYCEISALYWAWKNLNCEYLGLVHYRRHFSNGKVFVSKRHKVINREKLEEILGKTDIILPKKRHYWIETNYNQYTHAHHEIDLSTTRRIIEEKYPEYVTAYDRCMQRTNGHRFNMFVMKWELLNEYCTWLFDILFELERRLDISKYSSNDARVFGFLSERLLDPWIETRKYSYIELPYVFMESQNWFVKGGNFIKRKMIKQHK